MAKTETELPGSIGGDIERTSELINDGEFGDSRFVEENELTDILEGLTKYELIENKQNNLNIDGTGTKYPTVDAVNNALSDISLNADKNFVYEQINPSTEWIAYHGLNKKVSPIVTDSAGTIVEGQVIVNDGLKVIVKFNHPFTGYLICN